MGYYSAIKRNGILIHATTQMLSLKHYTKLNKPDTKDKYFKIPFM